MSSFRPEFPLVWNDSLRSAFVSCPRAAYWEFFHHWRTSGRPSTHLHAGKAWAAALETTRKAYYGKDKLDALTAQALGLKTLIETYGDHTPPDRGTEANKTLDRMMEAFQYYFTAFPLDQDPVQPYYDRDGNPMVEFNFALPIDQKRLLHPDTGEPILFAGRADMVATFAGALSIYDDKTTSQLGATWANQWNRRSQFSAYAWAAREYGINVSQIVVRGIAILKEKINHAQALPIRSPHNIAEWHEQTVRDIQRAIQCWREGYFDVNLSDSCSSFGGCPYQQPCMSSDPDRWLESGYVRMKWDPVNRTETLISAPESEILTLE